MIGLLLRLNARFKRYTAPMVLEARLKKLPKIDFSSFWLTVSDEVADEATTCITCLHSFLEDRDRCDFGRARCCGDLFHRNCVQTYFNFTGTLSRPICRKSTYDVSIIDTTPVKIMYIELTRYITSVSASLCQFFDAFFRPNKTYSSVCGSDRVPDGRDRLRTPGTARLRPLCLESSMHSRCRYRNALLWFLSLQPRDCIGTAEGLCSHRSSC